MIAPATQRSDACLLGSIAQLFPGTVSYDLIRPWFSWVLLSLRPITGDFLCRPLLIGTEQDIISITSIFSSSGGWWHDDGGWIEGIAFILLTHGDGTPETGYLINNLCLFISSDYFGCSMLSHWGVFLCYFRNSVPVNSLLCFGNWKSIVLGMGKERRSSNLSIHSIRSYTCKSFLPGTQITETHST